jgi:SAM-dependent methyltransferase
MGVLRRIAGSVRARGVISSLRRVYVVGFDYWFDLRYRIRTADLNPLGLNDLTVVGSNKERGTAYQATRILPLKNVLQQIQPLLPPGRVLVDLGCGKGRVLIVASMLGFREVRGIEFAPELCGFARSNCAAYKRATGIDTEFRIIESDVVDYAIKPDENVFFMFNPFDDVVLDRVLGNLMTSLHHAPRKVLVIYHHPQVSHVFQRHKGLTNLLNLDVWGYRYEVYSNAA